MLTHNNYVAYNNIKYIYKYHNIVHKLYNIAGTTAYTL